MDERRNEIERYKHHDSGELEEEPNGPAVVEAKSPQQPEALAVLGSPVSSVSTPNTRGLCIGSPSSMASAVLMGLERGCLL